MFTERQWVCLLHISMLHQQPPAAMWLLFCLHGPVCPLDNNGCVCEQSNVLIKNGESVACTSCLPPPFIIRRQPRIPDEAKIVRFNISGSSSSSLPIYLCHQINALASHAFIMMNDEMNKRSFSAFCSPRGYGQRALAILLIKTTPLAHSPRLIRNAFYVSCE